METSGTQPAPPVSTGSREQFAEERLPVGLPWRLSIFSLALFALALFAYLGMHFGYRAYLEREISGVDADLKALAAKISTNDREQFTTFYSQILNLKNALERHLFSSNVFQFLERNVANGVVFSAASLDMKALTLKLEGTAETFDTLAGQMALFARTPEVQNASLETISFAGTLVHFSVDLTFKQDAFVRPLVP